MQSPDTPDNEFQETVMRLAFLVRALADERREGTADLLEVMAREIRSGQPSLSIEARNTFYRFFASPPDIRH